MLPRLIYVTARRAIAPACLPSHLPVSVSVRAFGGEVHTVSNSFYKASVPCVTSSQLRKFSKMSGNKVVSYEEVVTYKDKPEVYLIDVREPKELQELGQIPASINIPLGDVSSALRDSKPDDFQKKFGKEFPDKNKELVFYCMKGGRATKAMDQAAKLGFSNSKVYKGSWEDWASHQSK